MVYCINPQCANPENVLESEVCQGCGYRLLLKETYAAIKRIGSGGFGRTFLAVDYGHPEKQRCVIKQLFPDTQNVQSYTKTLKLFQQEAQQLKRLGKHPQIPDCFDSFEENGHQYIIQEFIDGNNLAQQLTSNGLFTEEQIVDLLREILPTLKFIHQQGVIHRDIKPANIIYSRAGNSLWLVDLGAAKQLTGTALAQTGTVIGSAEYTAPEQVRGKATFASDIYSLGVSCIYLLTGVSPFNLYDTGDSRWVWQDFLPEVIDSKLGDIIDNMIQMSTNKRYQAVRDIQTDLAIIIHRRLPHYRADNDFGRHEAKSVAHPPQRPSPEPSSMEQNYTYGKTNKPVDWLREHAENNNSELKFFLIRAGMLRRTYQLASVKSVTPSKSQGRLNLRATLLTLLIICAFGGAVLASRLIRSTNPLRALTNISTETASFEYTFGDSLTDGTSANWHIKTYSETYGFRFKGTNPTSSTVGFWAQNRYSQELHQVIWNFEGASSSNISATLLSNMGFKFVVGSLGNFPNGDPLVIDQQKDQLKALNVLTGEADLVFEQQDSSIAKLIGINDKKDSLNSFLSVNTTRSVAHRFYHHAHNDFESDASDVAIKVWDLKTAKLLISQQEAWSSERDWPLSLISSDGAGAFSPNGLWLFVPNGSELIFKLWDLTSKQLVKTINADGVAFSSHADILIVEDHIFNENGMPSGQLSKVKLLDLKTQQYILQSSNIKRLALHPHEKIAAIFDGKQIFLDDISGPSRKQIINLGDYPTVQNLEFSPDGHVLVGRLANNSFPDPGELIFWDVMTGEVLKKSQKIGGDELWFMNYPELQFSPDSRKLLMITAMGNETAGSDTEKLIQVWQVPQPLK